MPLAAGGTVAGRHPGPLGIDITPETSTSKWQGEKLHLADAVWMLFFQPKTVKQRADDLAEREREKDPPNTG